MNVTIAGRVFRLGADYRPKRGKERPRRLVQVSADGTVHWQEPGTAFPLRLCSGPTWARWAGKEIEDTEAAE